MSKNMTGYLLSKLAEEAGEVVVAAIKYKLHRSERTKEELAKELGDLIGVAQHLFANNTLDQVVVNESATRRFIRERGRMK
jgi:NTP pyrophosphatase (non-canonical NTP hydrolase)